MGKRIQRGSWEDLVPVSSAFGEVASMLTVSDAPPLDITTFDNFVQDIFSRSYPSYDFSSWHIRKLCATVDQVLAKPDEKYLLAVLPRGHLKSTILGEAAQIYGMLINGGDGFYTSYSETLACLSPWTSIRTCKGYKTIEFIQIGDKVLTHKNRYRRVTKVFQRDVDEEICVIELENGTTFHVTKNHPILVDNEWVCAEKIVAGMSIIKPLGPNQMNGCSWRGKTHSEHFGKEKAEKWGNKISKRKKGHFTSEESKAKMSQSHLGKTPWNKLPRKAILCPECGKGFEVKCNSEQIFCSTKCYKRSLRGVVNISLSKACGDFWRGKKRTDVVGFEIEKQRIKKVKEGYRKFLENFSCEERATHFTNIQRKAFVAREMKPNNLENDFKLFLDTNFPKCWDYVGDGTLWINGKNPDFIHTKNKLIIEVFGDYWHKGEDPTHRIGIFKKWGYDTLVIWESEFRRDADVVKERIKLLNDYRHIKVKSVSRQIYSGKVHNLEIEEDHSYCGKGAVFHNCYHTKMIKEAIRNNPKLSGVMTDLTPLSDAMIYYRIGKRRSRVYSSGIGSVKRGMHFTSMCLLPDTRVMTAGNPGKGNGGGYKPISQVAKGDKVRSHQNKYREVTNIFVREVDEEVIVLKLDNNEVVKVTANHPILAKTGWKNAGDLTIEDILLKVKFYDCPYKGKKYEEIYGPEKGAKLRKEKLIGVKRGAKKGQNKGVSFEQRLGIERTKEIKQRWGDIAAARRVEWQCLNCGVIKYLTMKHASNPRHKFCSSKCTAQYNAEGAGLNFRAKVGNFFGKNNPNWKDGKSFLPPEGYSEDFTDELRKSIYRRDNHTCQLCGKTRCMVHCHHIDYNKKNSDGHNLITLCKSCHAKTCVNHREKWISLFQVKMLLIYGCVSNGTHIVRIDKEHYKGPVYNLEVAEDHTFIGRGIIFHNCTVDDIQGDPENPMNLNELEKVKKIFNAEVMQLPNIGCPLFVVGTTMDFSDLLFSLNDNPHFTSIWLPAINPDPEHDVLWEKQYSRKVLESRREAIGNKAFQAEFLLVPALSVDAFIPRDEIDKVVDKTLKCFSAPGW